MRFLDKRIGVICENLKKLSVVDSLEITDFKRKQGYFITPEDADASNNEWCSFDSKADHWYGVDCHDHFRTFVTVPKRFEGKPIWFNVRTQIDEWDDAKNPQFIIFVNGEPIQGVDMNHRRVFITKEAVANTEYQIDLQGYTGILHSEFRLLMDLQHIDAEIEALYYDLYTPLLAFDRMGEGSKDRMDIEHILNECVNILDLRNPYSEEFYASVRKAREYIGKALYEEMAGYSDVIASCIGHTHIDVAWWWTVAQTREKVARSFLTVLKLMEEYDDYKFMSSQPQLYAFFKERYPDIYARLKERVKEGRFEPEGGMWVEPDCNLTSGESLVRQFMYGKRFFKDEFGVDNKILWLPDVFGYSGALPQIMKKCGIDYFMTTKLSWNQINKVPYDTLMWRGIDGSEVFTHFISTLGTGQNPEKNFFTTYNGDLHPDAIMGGWERYQNKLINNDILISYGYGDGGGGPTRKMLEISSRMSKGVKGIPKVRQVFSRNYFDELKERVLSHKRLPVWEGEFYFEYHRGTYTSMARNKRSNRKGEINMMDLEFFSTLATLSDKTFEYDYNKMEELWKVLLINQFHDILPGSSIAEVYEVTAKEYAAHTEDTTRLIGESTSLLLNESDDITIFNTTAFDRDELISIPAKLVGDNNALKHGDDIFPIEATENGEYSAYVKKLPAKGGKTYTLEKLDNLSLENKMTLVNEYELDTPFYHIIFDKSGFIISIYDKENERELAKEDGKLNALTMYEDKPIYYDNWDIDMFYSEKSWEASDIDSHKWIVKGKLKYVLEQKRHISNSTIVQKITFYRDSKRIDFDTYVDWKEHQHLLKVHFPLEIHTDEATFEIQFGNLKRKTHTNTSWDEARFEMCGHKWMDISEGNFGVSLLNDCKYGHSVKDGNVAITLIKSGIEPNKMADYEEHYFTYALYPHAGNIIQSDTVKEAYKLNFKPYVVKGSLKNFDGVSFAKASKSNVVLETIKASEDGQGIVVRLYECTNSKTKFDLELPQLEIADVRECNLLEEVIERRVEFDRFTITDTINPYEIKTYKIILKK